MGKNLAVSTGAILGGPSDWRELQPLCRLDSTEEPGQAMGPLGSYFRENPPGYWGGRARAKTTQRPFPSILSPPSTLCSRCMLKILSIYAGTGMGAPKAYAPDRETKRPAPLEPKISWGDGKNKEQTISKPNCREHKNAVDYEGEATLSRGEKLEI